MQLSLFKNLCSSAKRLLGASFTFGSALAITACGGAGSSGPGSSAPATITGPTVSAVNSTVNLSLSAQVGQNIFFDKTLSASGKLSCAGCHAQIGRSSC